jgi:hypothetical protein
MGTVAMLFVFVAGTMALAFIALRVQLNVAASFIFLLNKTLDNTIYFYVSL